MTTREAFIKEFDEKNARALETAADSHLFDMSGHAGQKGSDDFKWVLITCISFQCAERHAAYHGISIPWQTLRVWIKQHADLRNYDGGFDALSLFAGAYNEFMPDEEGGLKEE